MVIRFRVQTRLLVALQVYILLTAPNIQAFDYSDALDKSLMFFEAQRSGKLPSDQRVTWRGDSGLSDGLSEQVDLVGGYYDAGDHVKFGLPMAYSVTLIAWAAIEFRSEIEGANQMDYTLAAIRWGTDYFVKAHSENNVLWAQVGDGEDDHSCWQRSEDMTTSRTAYRLDSSQPGSDLAGETAATLAAASLAFKPFNSSYSTLLLTHAKQLFTFADNFRCQYDDSIPSAETFYPSSGYSDELLWAAAWLYRATKDDFYLQYATDNAVDLGGTGNAVDIFSWDNKYAGLQILLSKVFLEGDGVSHTDILRQYKAKADYFTCSYLQKNTDCNVEMTPGGLAYLLPSNNLQYAASASFLLAVYSDYLSSTNSHVDCPDELGVQPQALLKFAKSQADYILGENPNSMSYLVGYGTKYPEKTHHRGSSIPSKSTLPDPVGCVQGFESWYKNSNPNPNIVYGALVGGPDSSDCFLDERDNYEQSEPTTSAVAPLIGLFSRLLCESSSTTTTPDDDSPTNSQPISPPTQPPPPAPKAPKVPPSDQPENNASSPLSEYPLLTAPAPSPSYKHPKALEPSPEAVDYVLKQPQSSSSTHEESFKYLLVISMTILMPLIVIM